MQFKALTAFTTLNITVIDDNDQNPEFVKPGCSSPCEIPEYEAVVGITDSIHETVWNMCCHSDIYWLPLTRDENILRVDIPSGT